MIVRKMAEKDNAAFKALFDEAYGEYLESLRLSNSKQYQKELQEEREVTQSRFGFYFRTGSSFVAEENSNVIGYVASQTVPFMHGFDRLLWIEYIVVKSDQRRKGVATALLQGLIEYARNNRIDRIYTTINPDNEASIKLHQKAGFKIRNWNTASFILT